MFITLEHNSISQRLVSYRQQLGKSQAEMSREFGVNQATTVNWKVEQNIFHTAV